MALLQWLRRLLEMEQIVWNSLHNAKTLTSRLVSDNELQALIGDPDEEVKNPYAQSLPMHDIWHGNSRRNLILAALSEDNYDAIKGSLEAVKLSAGQVIYEGGRALQHVYFPTTCTVSLLSSTMDGETVEVALTDRNGFVGVPLVLGATSMATSVQVLCAGQAYRMSADRFMSLLRDGDQLQQLAMSYAQSLMMQMAQSIVCSRHHSVSERLSQWILRNSDGLGSHELMVTHETISNMLGVRRESVTQAAGKFQSAGWIRNSRGRIAIQDRSGLLRSVCECYARIQDDSAQYAHRLGLLSERPRYNGAQYVMHMDSEPVHDGQQDLHKYVDVYDFAPVGFVTLNAQALVTQTNLSAAIMLDIQRSQCQHKPFLGFLDEASRNLFMAFHWEVLSGQCRRFCVVNLPATAHRAAMTLRIDATADESGEENRMVLIDLGSDQQSPVHHGVPEVSVWQFGAAARPALGAFKA
ncbi:Crp/Fnr family transcriptional regulator [Limnohabitans sp. Rim8]|uniref:Crp/Fnr family transcriptional regulator n=1 Tax=Limnohabitans sp. Rim8 TaxID=1100718 RepID=UPI00261DEC19|nr:Crp/Fnr family transcriptional regulator [Limnohabitans sp. Rim8]